MLNSMRVLCNCLSVATVTVGHVRVATNPQGDDFTGVCPFHGSCVEGMSASGALCARKGGITVEELAALSDEDPVWDQCAYQLAQLCANLVLIASPDRIRFGGGVMNRQCLYPKIRVRVIFDII